MRLTAEPLTDAERATPLLQLPHDRMMQAFDERFGPDPLYVVCPYCKAVVGSHCTDRSGVGQMPHPSRFVHARANVEVRR
jgi:hypothetical protein